jgi:hypothetical protein
LILISFKKFFKLMDLPSHFIHCKSSAPISNSYIRYPRITMVVNSKFCYQLNTGII